MSGSCESLLLVVDDIGMAADCMLLQALKKASGDDLVI